METTPVGSLFENAGRLVDRRSMVWFRKLDAPLEQVWKTVSTKEGLKTWWMAADKIEIDLRPGGIFQHHWQSTIVDVRENALIAFNEMQLELKSNGEGTLFSFVGRVKVDGVPGPSQIEGQAEEDELDVTQPGGPGTLWTGVAAGWHCQVDALETAIIGRTFEHTWEDGCRFYAGYLGDLYRWERFDGNTT